MDWDWLAWRWLSSRAAKGVVGVIVGVALVFNIFGIRDWVSALYQERAQHRLERLIKSVVPQPSPSPIQSTVDGRPSPSSPTTTTGAGHQPVAQQTRRP